MLSSAFSPSIIKIQISDLMWSQQSDSKFLGQIRKVFRKFCPIIRQSLTVPSKVLSGEDVGAGTGKIKNPVEVILMQSGNQS